MTFDFVPLALQGEGAPAAEGCGVGGSTGQTRQVSSVPLSKALSPTSAARGEGAPAAEGCGVGGNTGRTRQVSLG